MDFTNYTPAPNYVRVLARSFDWLLMALLFILIYVVSGHSILHQRPILFCVIALFYLLVYCPISDAYFGGTFGKQVAKIRLIQLCTEWRSITLIQAYKRIFVAAWPTFILIAAILCGVFYNSRFAEAIEYNPDEPSDNPTFGFFQIGWYVGILGQLGFLLFRLNPTGPETKQEYEDTYVERQNKGQGWHDVFASTIVIRKIEPQPSVYDLYDMFLTINPVPKKKSRFKPDIHLED